LFGGFSRWNILGDETLSRILPEVFAPPPKSSPISWLAKRMRHCGKPRRLFGLEFVGAGFFSEAQQLDRASKDAECRHVHAHNKMIEKAMRLLRTEVFDRVGHRRLGRTVLQRVARQSQREQ
jgi:hypothetical protein